GVADVREVAAQQVGDDETAAVVDLSPLQRSRQQLQLRELHRFVNAPENAVDVGARLDQLSGQPQRLRARVRVLKTPCVGDERDVKGLRDLGRQIDAKLRKEIAQHLPRRGSIGDDQVEPTEARVVVV